MYIKTKRLLIRKFELKDLQAVYAYTSDIHVMKYIPEGVFTDFPNGKALTFRFGMKVRSDKECQLWRYNYLNFCVFLLQFFKPTNKIGIC